jgi:nicotinamidase-related amidase
VTRNRKVTGKTATTDSIIAMTTRAAAIFDADIPYSPLSVPPAGTALLLLDYQNLMLGFVSDAAKRTQILTTAAAARSWAMSHGIMVYHCLVDMQQAPVHWAKLNARWSAFQQMIAQNPNAAGIVTELTPDPNAAEAGEKVTRRQAGLLSALSSPELKQDLEQKGIKSVICCGISTSAVVLSTARAANELGFLVTVLEDACFDPGEGVHEMLVREVLTTSAHVARWEEVERAWEGVLDEKTR